ncbi:MAG: hypothetical protein JW863_12530 [Chitinispirillaceae bacterium]|nr:hypothetical protein [Chitinispirillaceae bacterium]
MMKNLQLFLLFLLFFTLNTTSAFATSTNLEERVPYSIPLLKLSVIDENTGVRISKESSENYVVIKTLTDFSVKNSRSAVNKTTYRESPEKAYRFTDFEANQILLVTKSFVETLDEFEKNLRSQRWGHCRYLDAFLPKFMRGYYILLGASKNNVSRYSSEIALFENSYEVSLNSPLTDARINSWKSTPERTVKLRIATKELIYQLKQWEKRELANKNRNPDISMCSKAEEALGLFIRIYFSVKVPSFCSQKDKSWR